MADTEQKMQDPGGAGPNSIAEFTSKSKAPIIEFGTMNKQIWNFQTFFDNLNKIVGST